MVAESSENEVWIARVQRAAKEHGSGERPVVVLPRPAAIRSAPHAAIIPIDQAVARPHQGMVVGVDATSERHINPLWRQSATGTLVQAGAGYRTYRVATTGE